MQNLKTRMLILLSMFFFSESHSCVIEDIRFTGNKKSQPIYLLFQSGLKVGGDCSATSLQKAEQNLRNTELYKTVSIQASSNVVDVNVKEKFYYLPIPQASRSGDGELSVALKLEANNMLGLGHTLSMRTKHAKGDDGEGNETESHFIRYEVPRFIDSNFGGIALVETEEAEKDLLFKDDNQGLALTNQKRFELGLTYWLTPAHNTFGRSVTIGLFNEHRDYHLIEGSLSPFEGGNNNGIYIEYIYDNVQVGDYRRTGTFSKYRFTGASTIASSDFNYQRLEATWRHYLPIDFYYLDNLNLQAKAGIANNAPYNAPPEILGGSRSIRGFEEHYITGFNFYQINMQWLSALKSKPAVRLGMFLDVGDANDEDHFSIESPNVSTGASVRWKIRSLVKTDLRADIALSEEGTKAYIGTRSVF